MFTDLILFDGEKLGFAKNSVKVELIRAATIAELQKKLNSAKGLKVVSAGEENLIRAALENKKTDILIVEDLSEEKDFMKHRQSGLNKIFTDLARKNDVRIAFSFSQILNSKNRQKFMGRLMQNIKLCRKSKAKMLTATFSKNKWESRAKEDLASLMKCLGMTPGEVNNSLEELEKLLKYKKENWVGEGIKVVG
ncbi:hypothetical protein HY643_04570 [Candidatus Woesearchaeota archaeon]|nr:hypothetical protein [Candidatus Woesearchaeota archaeon]